MSLKSNAQLNAESPELRDVYVMVDGLNVLDLNVAPGARAPRYSVQLSGDMGLTKNNKRAVYGHAAQVLNALLEKGFSAHANVSREDLDNDILQATELVRQAISLLTESDDNIALHCHSLSISVTACDFNLTEIGIVSHTAMDKVEFLLEQPAEPSEALIKLMTGDRKNLIREDLGESAPVTTSLGTTTTIMIEDILHVRRDLIDYHDNEVVVWVPDFLNKEINSYKDIPLGQITRHGDASNKPTYILRIRRKEIDGVPHERRLAFDPSTDDFFFMWIPSTLLAEVTSKDISVNDEHLKRLPDEDHEVTYQWVTSN